MITEMKDSTLRFLERVTYDEVMFHTYMLDAERRGEDTEQLTKLFIEKYNVEEEDRLLYGRLSNWHHLNIPTSDWRINYFLSVGRGYPEETLYEQFGDLKEQGDKYEKLIGNALKYSNRMTEILIIQNAINALYPVVISELGPDIEVGFDPSLILAYSNTDSLTLKYLIELVNVNLTGPLIYQITPDLLDKIAPPITGSVSIVAGSVIKDGQRTQLIGRNGTLILDKPAPLRKVTLVE